MCFDRYPIGKFVPPASLDEKTRQQAIAEIARTPKRLRDAVSGLSKEQLDTPYRQDGWTVRQVVHHLPDSHINAYARCKLALTEDEPLIRTFDEAGWAELPDSQAPVEMSLRMLDALHERWIYLYERIDSRGWSRCLRHPDMGLRRLDEWVVLYAWHGRHHVAQITMLRDRMGW